MKSSRKSLDLNILHGANPLIVLGVYYYANELKDPVTMWHLYNHEYIPISLEDYIENWTKEETILIKQKLCIMKWEWAL